MACFNVLGYSHRLSSNWRQVHVRQHAGCREYHLLAFAGLFVFLRQAPSLLSIVRLNVHAI